MIAVCVFIASQEISATSKQHICDMQFNAVAVALKSWIAIMHEHQPQTAYRKDAVLTGTIFEERDKKISSIGHLTVIWILYTLYTWSV